MSSAYVFITTKKVPRFPTFSFVASKTKESIYSGFQPAILATSIQAY
jgi:hypothetical protein